MLTYEATNLNFLAITTADSTNDNNEIFSRLYENDVEVHYTINEETQTYHLLYIESHDKGHGNGSRVLKDIINEFENYNIIADVLFYLYDWYCSFGFQYEYHIDEMLCIRMSIRR